MYSDPRTLLALRENKEGGTWQRTRLCMGDGDTCTGDLVGTDRKKYILSFGEDEDGELYILTTSDPTPTAREGVVYQIIDPSRCVCTYVLECNLIIIYTRLLSQTCSSNCLQAKSSTVEVQGLTQKFHLIRYTPIKT